MVQSLSDVLPGKINEVNPYGKLTIIDNYRPLPLIELYACVLCVRMRGVGLLIGGFLSDWGKYYDSDTISWQCMCMCRITYMYM